MRACVSLIVLSVMFCACLWMLCNMFVCLVCDLPCDGGWCVCLCAVCEVFACFLLEVCSCVLCVSYNVTLPVLFFAGFRMMYAFVRCV